MTADLITQRIRLDVGELAMSDTYVFGDLNISELAIRDDRHGKYAGG